MFVSLAATHHAFLSAGELWFGLGGLLAGLLLGVHMTQPRYLRR